MEFRHAEYKDIPELLPLCKEHFKAAKMAERGYTYAARTAEKTLHSLLESPDKIKTLVAVDSVHSIQGIIMFALVQSIFDENDWSFNEVLWYARTPKLMIEIFDTAIKTLRMDWAKVHVGIPPTESIARFLKKKGFHLSSYIFVK